MSRARRRSRHGGGVSDLAQLALAAGLDPEDAKDLVKASVAFGDPGMLEELRECLVYEAVDDAIDPFGRPPGREIQGEFVLGRPRGGSHVFGVNEEELKQHVLIVGRSGAGKTSKIIQLARQIMKAGMKCLYFDRKRDFPFLIREFEDLWVFRLSRGEFKCNPLELEIDAKAWAAIFTSVFSNTFGFHGGAQTENLLFKRLVDLYSNFDSEAGDYPTLFDLLADLRKLKDSRKIEKFSDVYNSLLRLINRLEAIEVSLGETVGCIRGFPLEEILSHNVVIDLSGVKPDMASFFTETLLMRVLAYKIDRGER